jgi:hypothetical protein
MILLSKCEYEFEYAFELDVYRFVDMGGWMTTGDGVPLHRLDSPRLGLYFLVPCLDAESRP